MKEGYEKLWAWFSLSYASFLIMPRVMMHDMPDDWQNKLADLLNEWDEHWDQDNIGFDSCSVQVKKNNKFCKIPDLLKNYRYPDREKLNEIKKSN